MHPLRPARPPRRAPLPSARTRASCLSLPPLSWTGFALFFAWALSPFVLRRKHFHFVVLLKRVLVILVSVLA